MERAILPIGKAHEPNEGARNPMVGSMSPQQERNRRIITFAADTDLSEKSASQKSYKEVLSQPAPGLSHRQKLVWLQKRRTRGLWVQCDDCDRWRFLPYILDRHELPNKWYCRMNTDSSNADCSVPEAPIRLRDEEDLIHSSYSAGSVVWARMPGWPWWPAMVDDCPDTEQFYWLDGFSDIPTHYNVVFFDSKDVTRGWIAPSNLKPYTSNKHIMNKLSEKKYKNRLESAMKQADDAALRSLLERLETYSFIAKYKGIIDSPKKPTKKDLIRHTKKIKRQFNVDFPIKASESDDDNEPLKTPTKKKNMIILGTPKRGKAKRAQGNKNNATTVTNIQDDKILPLTQEQEKQDTAPNNLIDKTPTLPSKREKPKKRIHHSMNDTDTPKIDLPKGDNDGLSTNEFKQPNSMAVQVGSTTDTVTATESYDNDTSKTYVPELRHTLESTDNDTEMGTQEFESRAVSPNSGDFDF